MAWEHTSVQRFLTVDFISKKRLNAPAIFLRPESGVPTAEDALRPPEKLDTDIQTWRLKDDDHNLGVRLVDGYIELKLTAPDDVWIDSFFDACASLKVDARAAYGREGHPISSILFRIDDPTTIERWTERWPRGHKDKTGAWVEAKFVYSVMPGKKGGAVWRDSSPLPGSRFGGALVVWRPLGKPAADNNELGLEDLESRALHATNMESIVRAIAFATLAYWIRVYLDGLTAWDESLIRAIGGWIARLIPEGKDINARGKSLEGVCWSPIDDAFSASELVTFLESKVDAPRDLGVSLANSIALLERNASVPGWNAIETLFGVQAKIGIRRAFRAGLDIDLIERMSEQYVLDASDHVYLDREALLKGLKYEHRHDDLLRLWENEPVFVRQKPVNPFRLYAASQLRTDVQRRDFFPAGIPGAVLRYSPVHGLLKGDESHPDEYRLLNTYPGISIRPIATIDSGIMGRAVSMLDKMLGLLTRDNDAQMTWLKKFIAQLVQTPDIKPQVCPILVGGQGIGKSQFGDNFMRGLLGSLAGQADASALTDNKFVIAPFLGKLLTFIDEVKLESRGAINAIKKLVRADYVSGQLKYGHQRDFYVPSRILIATNQPDIGLSPEDAGDRCFFFIMSWTAENKRMHEGQFQQWALTLKPFYLEFVAALEKVIFKQHLMRFFMDMPVERAELEDLKHSSKEDETVVMATMSKPRDLARRIIADARVVQGLDITAWFNRMHVRDAIRRHEGPRSRIEASEVIGEFERAELIEKMAGDMMRFKWGYGRLLEKTGEAHGLPLAGAWPTRPGVDWTENDVRSTEGAPDWRGNKRNRSQPQPQQQPQQQREDLDDPDYLGPE